MNPALLAMLRGLFGDKIDDVINMIATMKKAGDEMVASQQRIENRLANIEAILKGEHDGQQHHNFNGSTAVAEIERSGADTGTRG
jgi:phage-related protein